MAPSPVAIAPVTANAVRAPAFNWRQRRSASRQAAGISDNTLMRLRTSSERLLSCVEVASMVCGQRAARSALASWKSATLMPNTAGSPPTSFNELSGK